jgi:hypothetical protein
VHCGGDRHDDAPGTHHRGGLHDGAGSHDDEIHLAGDVRHHDDRTNDHNGDDHADHRCAGNDRPGDHGLAPGHDHLLSRHDEWLTGLRAGGPPVPGRRRRRGGLPRSPGERRCMGFPRR